MLRFVGDRSATIWVETDRPCAVSVLGHTTRTFTVERHHYALVIVEGLLPNSVTPYDVRLDGQLVWPIAGNGFPASVIRTLGHDRPSQILFGSCRAAAPHEEPWTLELEFDERGRGVDAMREHGLRMLDQRPEAWPDLLILLGDQVYADDSSPRTRERIKERRAHLDASESTPDFEEVADFEEYTWLYDEAWTPEVERWMFSVVPSAMIFDDHDMIDDWNISQSWVEDIRARPWWQRHVTGGVMAYWIYQHLGNLGPDQIREEGMLDAFVAAGDASELLLDWALRSEHFTPVPGGYRFSYCRDIGRTRLVVIDCRNGRVLEPLGRRMVDDDEWAWVAEHAMGECDHLVLATSLPVLMPGGHEPPSTVCMVSGDVHFTYGVAAQFPAVEGRPPVASAVHQLVCSPIRNALVRRERIVIRFAVSRAGRLLGSLLRRSVRGDRPRVRWNRTPKIMFNNDMAVLRLDGRTATVDLHNSGPEDDRRIVLSRQGTAEPAGGEWFAGGADGLPLTTTR